MGRFNSQRGPIMLIFLTLNRAISTTGDGGSPRFSARSCVGGREEPSRENKPRVFSQVPRKLDTKWEWNPYSGLPTKFGQQHREQNPFPSARERASRDLSSPNLYCTHQAIFLVTSSLLRGELLVLSFDQCWVGSNNCWF